MIDGRIFRLAPPIAHLCSTSISLNLAFLLLTVSPLLVSLLDLHQNNPQYEILVSFTPHSAARGESPMMATVVQPSLTVSRDLRDSSM